MDNLNHRSKFYRAIALVIEKLRGQKQQSRADSLASASPQILPDLGNGGDVRHGVTSELLFNRNDVVAQKIENLFPVNGRGRSQFRHILP